MGDSLNGRFWRMLGDGRDKLLQNRRSPDRSQVPIRRSEGTAASSDLNRTELLVRIRAKSKRTFSGPVRKELFGEKSQALPISSESHFPPLQSVSKQKEAAADDIAKAGGEDCNFERPNLPPKSNAWNNQGATPDPSRDILPKNPSNVTPSGGAAHSSSKDQPEPENDGFTPVPKHKGKRQSEEVRSPSKPRAGSNLFKILEDEDVTGVQLRSTGRSGASFSRQPGKLNPEPEAAYTTPVKAVSSRDTHNGKPELPEKVHQNSLPVVSPNAELQEQIKVKETTLEVPTNQSQDGASGNPYTDLTLITMDSLGAWAEVEDNEMTKAGSRGVKGRPSTDAAYTPDRGMSQREGRRHLISPQVVEQTPPEILYLDWQERVDI
ncbi:hypothetical protein R1sor_013947 [Riccia sorocarpa]|uniref:Uncharacterized protein n=1 Tax=Riccia sorocarpa TaxID=122646 RepID=A0ABD3H8K9_9MARC